MYIVPLLIRCVVIPALSTVRPSSWRLLSTELEAKVNSFCVAIASLLYTHDKDSSNNAGWGKKSRIIVSWFQTGMSSMWGMHGWITLWGFIVILRSEWWITATWGALASRNVVAQARSRARCLHSALWNWFCSFGQQAPPTTPPMPWPRFNTTVPNPDVTLYRQDSHVSAPCSAK